MVAIGHRSGGGRGRGRGDRGRGRGTWCARPLAAAPRSRRPMDPHPVSRWVRPTPAPTPQPPRHWLPLAVPTPAAGIPGLPRLLPPPVGTGASRMPVAGRGRAHCPPCPSNRPTRPCEATTTTGPRLGLVLATSLAHDIVATATLACSLVTWAVAPLPPPPRRTYLRNV
jgi:hypothetical protein